MLLWLAETTHAQAAGPEVPSIDAQLFRTSADAGRWWWVDPAGSAADPQVRAAALVHYTNDPLVYQRADGERVSLIADVAQLELTAAGRLGPVRLGAVVPAYLFVRSADETRAGLGELALDARLTAVDRAQAPFGLAAAGRWVAPTAAVPGLAAPSPTWELTVIADGAVGPVQLAANLGTAGGRRVDLENVSLGAGAIGRAGVAWAVAPDVELTLELAGRVPYTDAPSTPGAVAAEWLGGVSSAISSAWTIRAGGGTGLTAGVGAPDLRLTTGLAWSPAPAAVPPGPPVDDDLDDDGITDVHDRCAEAPEDPDDVRDTDGCPEPEVRVAVTLLDPAGGIPPLGSITVDGVDRSFLGPAASVFELAPGPWLVSGTAPGYAPASATLDVTGPLTVSVPLVAAPERRVDADRERITLHESIEFASGSATILPESFPLLDEIAALLRDTPEITRVTVEGHTDARGDDTANFLLSSARAAAVGVALAQRGVAAHRLATSGYGESRPLDPRDVEEAWAKNRRVEIRIAERVPPVERAVPSTP